MNDLTGTVYINGEFMPAADARISIFDSGFIAGINVFDTIACWQGHIFKLAAHLARFRRSVHAAAIPLVEGDARLAEIVIETTRRSGLRDAYIQVIATRGVRTSLHGWPEQPTLIVYAVPYIWILPPERIASGTSVITPSTRNMPPQTLDPKIKTLNRLHGYMAKLEGNHTGVDEVIMLDLQGFLTEGRGSNVFLVRNGALYTPAEGILQGITRETVFEIAAEQGLAAMQTALTPYDLYSADEAFLCTTAGGIIPIVQADGRTIGAGRLGPITEGISIRYWKRHCEGPDATPVFDEAAISTG
jgi:branched-chain amino acid aminotransferase